MNITNRLSLRNNILGLPALLLLVVVLVTGCGYTNPYTQTSELDENQDGVVSIYVDMWQNQTSELGFEAYIKQSLVKWLKKSRRFSIAQSKKNADYILKGIIQSAEYPGLSYGNFDRAIEIRSEMLFSYKLRSTKTSKLILNQDEFTRLESFRVAQNAVETEMNKRVSLTEMADDIAENIYMQLFYKFTRDDLQNVHDDLLLQDNLKEIGED